MPDGDNDGMERSVFLDDDDAIMMIVASTLLEEKKDLFETTRSKAAVFLRSACDHR